MVSILSRWNLRIGEANSPVPCSMPAEVGRGVGIKAISAAGTGVPNDAARENEAAGAGLL